MIIPKQRLQEIRRIRIVTKNYGVLRGLQGIPFGLVLTLLTAFLSIAPLIGFTAFHALFLPGHGGYELVFGVMMTIGGLYDHLLLLRAFRQTQRVYQS